MNCHMRMSHIILLLLWTLCYSGTGSSRNNDNGQSDTSTTSGNRNVSITASSTQPLHNLSPKGTNKLQLVTTVTTPIPNNEAVQKEQLKITVRSKLWSPYRNVVDDFLEENEDDERISTAPSTFSTGKSISTQSQSGGNEIQALNDEKMSDSPQKRPIISSIRHYRSRKSFVRTRKTPSDPSIVKSQSDLTAKSSHVVDLDDEEQGDQPFSHASTDAKVASGGVRSFGKLVEGKPSTKTGQSSSSTTTSSSGSISVETDGEMVYGIPYFISPTVKVGNTSTKAQKIDKLLLPKKTLMPIITSSNIRNSSISSSDRRIASPESYSTDTRYGAPVLQPTLDNKFTTKDSSVNSSNKARQQQISPQPTKKAKGGGGGGGKRSRGGKAAGTRKPEYADGDENKAPDDDGFGRISSSPNPSLSLDKRRNGKKKKIGGDFQHDAFRKVKEKTRKASRLPADIRDQSDYKSNYNLEPLSNDNDPMGGGGGAASPETQDQSRPWENLANNGGGVHVESEYFPNALDEGTRERSGAFKDDDDEASNPVESDDEYDHVATSSASPSQNEKPGSDIVTVFLRIVESQHTLGANCTRGTDFNLGDGVVDRYAQERFRLEAELTVNRANMLTRFWKYAEPKSLEDEYLLHAMVISLIEFDEDIFAAGNCYDENQYKNYTLFCPYGYREQDGSILVKDLSLEYPYLSNTSEWFYKARKDAEIVIKNYNQFRRGSHSFRWNETNLVEEEILNVTYEDGKWSKPYFDCGGGNIWMITYMVPFFGYNGHNETYYFKGTSGIDIDLRRVDIDQCPLPANSTELNIFAASDKCKNATTKCVPLKGLGFRRGSYRCICKDGFYFPNVSSAHKYFNGTLLEEEYEKKFTGFWQNETSLYDMDGLFECLPCPFGCDTCVDDRPCVVSLNWLMRTAILILQGAIIAMLPIVGLFTYKYSNVKVVRAASPVLLRFIVLGAFFIYCTILVNYPSPSVITCTLRVWLREIGFSLAYGSLLLKTWRISVIFRVRSAKAIKITDLDLMKRLGAIVGTFTSLLVIRTLVAPPIAIVSYTADELKAWLCKSDWWDHSMMIMELCFLVWGIRLCIVVRKAPSEFNESKFISLAIYNEFLLSLFLNISMLFLQSPANPDLLYIIFFCHVQFTMTLLLCLIFGSKAYIVFRGQGKGGSDESSRVPTSKFISKSRSGQTTKQTSAHNSTTGLHSSTTSTSHDPNLNSRLSEDVQEEFRRLYFQLEELKERNMRLGNRHLVAKIAAMQEAADNILCTSAQINGQQTGSGSSPNVKGKSGVLSDISEENPEENPSLPQSTAQTPKLLEATGNPPEFFSGNPAAECEEEDHRFTTTINNSPLKDPLSTTTDVAVEDGDRGQISQSKSKDDARRKRRDVVQFKNLELQDTNLDEVDSEEDERGVKFDLGEDTARSDIKPDCINDADAFESNKEGCENIPMQSLRKRRHKQKQSSTNPTDSQSAMHSSSSEIGKQQKSQNHSGTNNSKLVLDLDDKSRFTEEITV